MSSQATYKRIFKGIALLVISFFSLSNTTFDKLDKKVLVFTKTEGFRHQSIKSGVKAIKKLGRTNGFSVKHTEDASKFNDAYLKTFDLVIFLNTTGNILNENEQKSFEKFIKNGGSFMGIHSAADTEYDWPWYGQLVGAYFESHPDQSQATIHVTESNHIACKHLPTVWTRFDEWYNYKNISPKIQVLLTLDESSYVGGSNGEFHPIAWYQEFDGGQMFYTGGGHTDASYSEPEFLQHLLGGINYCLKRNTNE